MIQHCIFQLFFLAHPRTGEPISTRLDIKCNRLALSGTCEVNVNSVSLHIWDVKLSKTPVLLENIWELIHYHVVREALDTFSPGVIAEL